MADVKGDLSRLAKPGVSNARIQSRLELLDLGAPVWSSVPVTFSDGKLDHYSPADPLQRALAIL